MIFQLVFGRDTKKPFSVASLSVIQLLGGSAYEWVSKLASYLIIKWFS